MNRQSVHIPQMCDTSSITVVGLLEQPVLRHGNKRVCSGVLPIPVSHRNRTGSR